MIFGKTLVVGVQDDPETGCLRMYVDHRSRGLYALIENEDAKAELRREWAVTTRHLLVTPPPPSCLYLESERP